MAGHFTDDQPTVESNLFCPPCDFRPIRSWNMLSDILRGKVEWNSGETTKVRRIYSRLFYDQKFDIFYMKQLIFISINVLILILI